MKHMKRMLALLCAVAVTLSLLCVAPAPQAEASSRAELESQLSEANARKEQYAAQIEALQDDKDAAMEKKLLLDQRNSVLQEEINIVQAQVDAIVSDIAENEQKEAAQYELFCKQVRSEEERGAISYWSVIFKATGFADLLGRIDFINEIMEYDQRVITELRQLREQLAADREELEEKQADLAARQDELEVEIEAANAVLAEFEQTEANLYALEKREEEEADRITEELKNYYASNGGTSDGSTQGVLNGLIWPTNSTRYITSKFGPRNTGIPGASTNHKGVDIGAPRKTNIYAAQSGTVIQAGWNGGYGYSVTIAHDGGVSTLYGHMYEFPKVTVGQTVSCGQVIGLCGSTGVSSGAHIHYEVRVDGVPIDPINYLPGYILV